VLRRKRKRKKGAEMVKGNERHDDGLGSMGRLRVCQSC